MSLCAECGHNALFHLAGGCVVRRQEESETPCGCALQPHDAEFGSETVDLMAALKASLSSAPQGGGDGA